jgi:hypothetical protein
MTTRRLRWRWVAWWFPTVGPDNDRVVPWLGPARSLPLFLALYATYFALIRGWVGDDATGWAAFPTLAGIAVVTGFCGRQKDGSKVRHGELAVTVFCIVLVAVSFAGVWLFPAAGHAHPGPLRGLLYVIATVVAVYAFTAVTHWRRREATPRGSDGERVPLVTV